MNNDKIKILIVDDEQVVLDSIVKHLRHNKQYELYTALSVDKALEIMGKDSINIILTDLMMPDIDGLEFLKMIQEKDDKILAVMVTGYATINTAIQATELGAFDYIAKPFTRQELRKVIERAAELLKPTEFKDEDDTKVFISRTSKKDLTGIGEYSWIMMQDDDTVLVGVDRSFLYSIGLIKTVYLPSAGDFIRQGSVYFQIFSVDLRSQSLFAPLSGEVTEVNEFVLTDPAKALQDPYGNGWILKLKPSNFDDEIKLLGL